MTYEVTVYYPKVTNENFRFVLGKKGSSPLFVIGLNPSTADDKRPDLTIKRIIGYSSRNGYDSFIMLNLYAQRTPYPSKLDSELNKNLHKENLSHIFKVIEQYKPTSILAAWGGSVELRTYFKQCFSDIASELDQRNIKWLKIGELTANGHPRHASRGSYEALSGFDFEKYLVRLK